MTQHHCQGREVVTDGIALAAYTMDSHNCDRVIVDGCVRNEGNVEVRDDVKPYPISYRSIVPKRSEVSNLFVPFCLSASHIAFGSIRMEPVAMVLAQVSATAASMAIDSNCAVQEVDVNTLKAELEAHPWGDNRKPDVVVDDADGNCVRFVGDWTCDNSRHSYAFSRRYDYSMGKTERSAFFHPNLKKSDEYHVYYYFPKQEQSSSVINFNIFDGTDNHEVSILTKDIKIVGQTRGEWVLLGTYRFAEGATPYVELTNRGADGTIVADAVQFVPTKR